MGILSLASARTGVGVRNVVCVDGWRERTK